MIKVSVIVPIYNVELYLERCILSLINQTLRDIEILLINDGSTDRSLDICKMYSQRDKRIVVINKENEGPSATRNLGIKKARGKFLGFVDSDDYVNKNMFMDMYNVAIKEKSDIVACDFCLFSGEAINDELSTLTNNTESENIRNFTNFEALDDYFAEKLEVDKFFHTVVWNKIYNRNLFENVEFPVGKLYEDGYVTYKLLYYSRKLTYIDRKYYYYFQRDGSIMNTAFNEKVLYSYDDWKEIYEFISSNCERLSANVARGYIYKHLSMYKTIGSNSHKIGKLAMRYRAKIKEDIKKDYKELINLDIRFEYKYKLFIFRYFNINLI